MSLFSPDRYRLQIAERTLVLSRRGARGREWQHQATGEHPGIACEPEFSTTLTQFCQLRLPRRARWSVLLDNALARFFMLRPPERVAGLRELELVSALRCESLFGDPAEDWACMGDWHAHDPFLVCALPTSLMRTLATVAALRRSRLDSVSSHFVQTWNECASRMRQQQAWVADVSAQHAILVATSGGRPTAVSQLTSSEWENIDGLQTVIRRTSLQWGLALPTTLYVAGESMRHWHGQSVYGCAIQHLMPAPTREPLQQQATPETPYLPAGEPQA